MPSRLKDPVYFEGPIRAGEKAHLRRTIRTVERRLALTAVPDAVGPAWVVIAARVPPGETYFLAHRMGYPVFLRARSVRALCHQIATVWSQAAQPVQAEAAVQ